MASQPATAGTTPALPRPRLPERLPDLKSAVAAAVRAALDAGFLLAIAGPVAGIWYRFDVSRPEQRADDRQPRGLALSEDDLTRVRFPVGPAARAAGVRPATTSSPSTACRLPESSRFRSEGIARPNDADRLRLRRCSRRSSRASSKSDLDLRLRARDGTRPQLSRAHRRAAYRAGRAPVGLPPMLLSVVDLLHVITYPFLLFAAWVLHRRKREDLISSILSLAILLTIAAEQPVRAFLQRRPQQSRSGCTSGSTISATSACLPASCCFRFGQLRPRAGARLLALLPLLFFLKGDCLPR